MNSVLNSTRTVRIRYATGNLPASWLRGSEMRRPVWGRNRPFPGIAGTIAALVAIALIALLAGWLGPQGKPLAGHPEIVDGDTLRFGATRVRLTGIDAPELGQMCSDANGQDYACGVAAKQFVVDFIGGAQTSCARSGR